MRWNPLTDREHEATRQLVMRIVDEVAAPLVEAALFGSKARGVARADSDVDVLLVFAQLPPSREPFATQAEDIAAEVASASGVLVTVWSVSLEDLRPGWRTPMLVDALTDAVPIWYRDQPLPAVAFTPADALRCSDALLERVEEGGREFARSLGRGRGDVAARRAREDIVRLCTALVLLSGVTRPRRGDVVELVLADLPEGEPGPHEPVLHWARATFGPNGQDEERPVAPPPFSPQMVAITMDYLRDRVARRMTEVADALAREEN